jgi:hypothetical protein
VGRHRLKEGFELVQVVPYPTGRTVYYLKRQKS